MRGGLFSLQTIAASITSWLSPRRVVACLEGLIDLFGGSDRPPLRSVRVPEEAGLIGVRGSAAATSLPVKIKGPGLEDRMFRLVS